ncbi:hypothetical protein [Streptomyces sp. NPDC059515]|uniref:hypothetical protein n=1 Tax=Streptomyces sp. NPDC059515 TaxID=3346854 RepID=UPI0036C1801C
MRTRTATAGLSVLLAAVSLTACSDGGTPDPKPTATVTRTVDTAAQRAACVDAWAEQLQGNTGEVDIVADEPAVCDGLPDTERGKRYMEGLFQRNEANRNRLDECLDDPTCTDLPVG